MPGNRPIYSIGADNGGTWLRFAAVDHKGTLLKTLRIPSPTVPQLPARIKKLLQTWKLRRVPRLIVASKGIWTVQEKNRLVRQLKPFSDTAAAFSDVELAYHGHFHGKKEGPGTLRILLIAGTGSMAYGRSKNRIARAGGLGAKDGDPGSGYWIGKHRLRIQALKTGKSQTQSIRETAGLAVEMLRRAQKGEVLPLLIVQEGADYLAELVWKTAQKLKSNGPIQLGYHGGLFQSRFFMREVDKALEVYFAGRKINAALLKEDAAVCAARMGLDGSWKTYLRADNPPR